MPLVKLSSLSGSGETYFEAQVKPAALSHLHMQVGTAKDYVSGSFPVTQQLWKWVQANSSQTPVVSLSGSGSLYRPCRVRLQDDDSLRVQIMGPKVNREYGVTFIVKTPLAGAVKVKMDHADAASVKPAAEKTSGPLIPGVELLVDLDVVKVTKPVEKPPKSLSEELLASLESFVTDMKKPAPATEPKPADDTPTWESLFGWTHLELQATAGSPKAQPACLSCGKLYGEHYSTPTFAKDGKPTTPVCPCPTCGYKPGTSKCKCAQSETETSK